MEYELKFDPKTIEHLGVKMYSTLPPALAELISNAYDADASEVIITFHEQNGLPKSIVIEDNGHGMSDYDIQHKFLVIGRNRRSEDGDKPSLKYQRLPTGKKGLGKLALFGLAKSITLDTTQNEKRNRFSLDWDELLNSDSTYKPKSFISNEITKRNNGTFITLANLKRTTPFDLESTADSLSRIFITDSDFRIILKHTNGKNLVIDNKRRYSQIESEFSWGKSELNLDKDQYEHAKSIEINLITGKNPIPPSSGLRGVTIFSRGKLVNTPEFFSDSTSSFFHQYLTGWIQADFIDLLDEDVISTNRQSINWENERMAEFRTWLRDLVSKVNASWREKRKTKKDTQFKNKTGIDKNKWLSTLPQEVKSSANKIIDLLSDDEGVDESFNPIVAALYEIIPEYPELHWRHLHKKIAPRIKDYYTNQQFAEAADQGTKIYAQIVRDISKSDKDGTSLAEVFNPKDTTPPLVQVSDLSTESGKNIQMGQAHLTRGVMAGFRNPMNHHPVDTLVPGTFSELDCLNILSLVSYLTTRLDGIEKAKEEDS